MDQHLAGLLHSLPTSTFTPIPHMVVLAKARRWHQCLRLTGFRNRDPRTGPSPAPSSSSGAFLSSRSAHWQRLCRMAFIRGALRLAHPR